MYSLYWYIIKYAKFVDSKYHDCIFLHCLYIILSFSLFFSYSLYLSLHISFAFNFFISFLSPMFFLFLSSSSSFTLNLLSLLVYLSFRCHSVSLNQSLTFFYLSPFSPPYNAVLLSLTITCFLALPSLCLFLCNFSLYFISEWCRMQWFQLVFIIEVI